MIQLKRIDKTDFPIIRPYFERQTSRLCNFTLGVVYMWAEMFEYKYAIEDGLLYLFCNVDDLGGYFFFPIGAGDIDKAFDRIDEYYTAHGIRKGLICTNEEEIARLGNRFGDVEIIESEGDYCYSANDLKTLSGKKFHAKKNHVNRFVAAYPNYTFKEIKAEDISKLKAFEERFFQTRDKLSELFHKERKYVEKVLDHYAELPFLVGGYIETDDGVMGFAIGEKQGDTLYVHIEKALIDVNGAYAAINKEFVQHFCDDSILYVNREDDAGDEGLRRAKLSYNPVFMARVLIVLGK